MIQIIASAFLIISAYLLGRAHGWDKGVKAGELMEQIKKGLKAEYKTEGK